MTTIKSTIVPPIKERRVAAVTAELTHQFLQRENCSDGEEDLKSKQRRSCKTTKKYSKVGKNDGSFDDAESNNSHTQAQTDRKMSKTTQKQNIYIVDKIIDKKQVGKKYMYLVKWEGYPEE